LWHTDYSGIVGSKPAEGIDIYLHLFWVCVVLCVDSDFVTGWSPVQGVPPIVYRIKKLKKRPRSNKRNVESKIDFVTLSYSMASNGRMIGDELERWSRVNIVTFAWRKWERRSKDRYIYCLIFCMFGLLFCLENWGSVSLRNICKFPLDQTESYFGWKYSSYSHLLIGTLLYIRAPYL
jgi:hypothetical protein